MSARKKPKLVEECGVLNLELVKPENLKLIQDAWKTSETPSVVTVPNCDLDIIQYPFPVCVLHNAVPTSIIMEAIPEIGNILFIEKSNDLYQFKQTKDVANMEEHKKINDLYKIFTNEIKAWVESTFAAHIGIKDNISATFSCYDFTDRLLCHDDKCDERHIAFVLYLTHGWSPDDGGNLQLFDTDKNGNPGKVVHSIPALFNNLVLFEVTPTSFHQVSEVTSQTKKRLSLNGWFHARTKRPAEPSLPKAELAVVPPTASEFNLDDLFLVNYCEFKNQLDIKSMFVANSEIQLEEFILPRVYSRLCEELSDLEIQWKTIGPANIRHYEIAEPQTLPSSISLLWSLLQSRAWFRFLKTITGLDVMPSTNSDISVWLKGRQPACKVEVQRWKPGCYTLMHDNDQEFHCPGLDTFLRLPMSEEPLVTGDEDSPEAGNIVYVEKQSQSDECLLHLGQKLNSLNMVYRNSDTIRFTKYIDSTSSSFYQIQGLYIPWAPPIDEPNLKHVESESETEPSEAGEENGTEGEGEFEFEGSPITEESDRDEDEEKDEQS